MLVTVARTEMAPEAHILRGRLEAEGIPAFVQHEHHVTLDWFISNALGGVRLQVPVEHAQAAIDVLKAVREGGFALMQPQIPAPGMDAAAAQALATASCPNCGEEGDAAAGSERGVALAFLHLFALPTPWRRLHWHCSACGHAWSTRGHSPYPFAASTLGGLMLLIGAAVAATLVVGLATYMVNGLCASTTLCRG